MPPGESSRSPGRVLVVGCATQAASCKQMPESLGKHSRQPWLYGGRLGFMSKLFSSPPTRIQRRVPGDAGASGSWEKSRPSP